MNFFSHEVSKISVEKIRQNIAVMAIISLFLCDRTFSHMLLEVFFSVSPFSLKELEGEKEC